MLSTQLGLRGYHEPLGFCLWLEDGHVHDMLRGRCPDISLFKMVLETVVTPVKLTQMINQKASFQGLMAKALMPDMVMDHYPVGYLDVMTNFLAKENNHFKAMSHKEEKMQEKQEKRVTDPQSNTLMYAGIFAVIVVLLFAVYHFFLSAP